MFLEEFAHIELIWFVERNNFGSVRSRVCQAVDDRVSAGAGERQQFAAGRIEVQLRVGNENLIRVMFGRTECLPGSPVANEKAPFACAALSSPR